MSKVEQGSVILNKFPCVSLLLLLLVDQSVDIDIKINVNIETFQAG